MREFEGSPSVKHKYERCSLSTRRCVRLLIRHVSPERCDDPKILGFMSNVKCWISTSPFHVAKVRRRRAVPDCGRPNVSLVVSTLAACGLLLPTSSLTVPQLLILLRTVSFVFAIVIAIAIIAIIAYLVSSCCFHLTLCAFVNTAAYAATVVAVCHSLSLVRLFYTQMELSLFGHCWVCILF